MQKHINKRVEKEQKKMIDTNKIIIQAKNKYPISISYIGKLTDNDTQKLEQFCDIKCLSLYMDGSAEYIITWKKEKNKTN